MNKNVFLKSMNILETAFKEKMSKGAINIYWSRMKGYSDKEFKETIIRCVDELKYFPRVANLKDMLDGTSEEEAELAWMYLIDKIDEIGHYQSVSFPDYPAIGKIVKEWGGWSRICDMTFREETFKKIEFVKLYPIIKKQGKFPKQLEGQFEIDNNNKGYNEETMLGIYGRKLNGSKVDRKLIENKSREIE